MPSPQYLSPQPVQPPRSQRRFTLAQANRTLPLVRRIVADIVRVHEHVMNLRIACQAMCGQVEQQRLQETLAGEQARLHGYLDELADVGADLKDYQIGLVDFIAHHQGRDICLCWKLGETEVSYWHELNAGFAGRQPVTLLGDDQ